MKVPANISGDKLILDYLARVTEAGLHYLPKGKRMAFVGQTRALIERECGPDGLDDPARVMEVLTALGEPEELVRQERARIDAAWLQRRSGRDSDEADPPLTTPRATRPVTSRWKPATDTQPLPRMPSAWPGEQEGEPGPSGTPQDGPAAPEPLLIPGARRPAALARAVLRLARRHPLESVVVLLLGIGGAILPFPCWLIAGLATMLSRLFDARDTWIALFGPPAITLAVTVVTAAIIRGPGNPVVIYFRALSLDTGITLRAGSLICAGYLAWRVRKGRRVRVPPWRR